MISPVASNNSNCDSTSSPTTFDESLLQLVSSGNSYSPPVMPFMPSLTTPGTDLRTILGDVIKIVQDDLLFDEDGFDDLFAARSIVQEGQHARRQ